MGRGNNKKRAHVIVDGIVQGVGYRYFVNRTASHLGLFGYARNLPDGRVEVLLEGPEEAITFMMEELRRGPSLSVVENVEVEWGEHSGEFHGFSIRF